MTEIAMPPVSALTSEDLDDNDVPFKILNQDNLPISIIGESIFKPFGTDFQKQKPNGIVYPMRRIIGNLQENKQKGFTKSHGHVNFYDSQNLNKDISISHGNLNHCNSAAKNRHDNTKIKKLDSSFTKILDAKLRKLQKEEKQVGFSKTKPETPRKPFITTVKKGYFLEPPPETASLHGFKVEPEIVKQDNKLYAYASKPRVLNKLADSAHRSRCETAAKAAAAISSTVIGLNHFVENLKDINGITSKRFKNATSPYILQATTERRILKENNYNQQLNQTVENSARVVEAKRRETARRRAAARNQRVRRSNLFLGTPSQRRKFESDEADSYLKELLNNPPVVDVHSQTDLSNRSFISSNKNGVHAETQIYPGDLFDFEMEVQPILDTLVGKTVEQALIEVLEEEELSSLRDQQRRFLERRVTEEEEESQQSERDEVLEKEIQLNIHNNRNNSNLNNNVILHEYVDNLLPNVLDGLKTEGLNVDTIVQAETNDSFIPWLMKEVTHELEEMVKNQDVITDIVREILENRAELHKILLQGSEESVDEGPTNENILISDFALKDEIVKLAGKDSTITTIS